MGIKTNKEKLRNVNQDVVKAFEPFLRHRRVRVLGFIRWDKKPTGTWVYFMFGKKILCAIFDDEHCYVEIAVYGVVDEEIIYNSIITNENYIEEGNSFYTLDGSPLRRGRELSEKAFEELKRRLEKIIGSDSEYVQIYQI